MIRRKDKRKRRSKVANNGVKRTRRRNRKMRNERKQR